MRHPLEVVHRAWVPNGPDDPHYRPLGPVDAYYSLHDLALAAVVAAHLLIAKYSLENKVKQIAKRGRASAATLNTRRCLLDEAWLALGGVVLAVWSCSVLNRQAACNLLTTSGCFEDWPSQARNDDALRLYTAEVGWYIHMLVAPLLRIGAKPASRDLIAHHLATLVALLISAVLDLLPIGVLALTIFNFSNPFLHISKICNYLDLALTKRVAFSLFGLVFFLTRLVMFPSCVLHRTLNPGLYIPENLMWLYYFENGLLVALCLLQLVWMWRIISVLWRGSADPPPALMPKLEAKKTM